jgi:serine/threonine protein kinase
MSLTLTPCRRLTPAAFDLLAAMFHYDPEKRPSAADVLAHAYFTAEQPEPRQAIEYVVSTPSLCVVSFLV